MNAHAFINALQARGATLVAAGGRLKVTPANALTDADRAAWQMHKAEILQVLANADFANGFAADSTQNRTPGTCASRTTYAGIDTGLNEPVGSEEWASSAKKEIDSAIHNLQTASNLAQSESDEWMHRAIAAQKTLSELWPLFVQYRCWEKLTYRRGRSWESLERFCPVAFGGRTPVQIEELISTPLLPEHECDADAERLRREVEGIREVLAGAEQLPDGDWRINGELYDHDNAVLFAGNVRGTTTNGYPLDFNAGAAYSSEMCQANKTEAPR